MAQDEQIVEWKRLFASVKDSFNRVMVVLGKYEQLLEQAREELAFRRYVYPTESQYRMERRRQK